MKNYTYAFHVFLKIQKTWLLRFLSCCTRFLEHWLRWLLGAQMFPGKTLDEVWWSRCADLSRARDTLSLVSSQDASSLLRASFSVPKVQHPLRCSPSANLTDWLTDWMPLLWHLTNRRWNYNGYKHKSYSLHDKKTRVSNKQCTGWAKNRTVFWQFVTPIYLDIE